MVPVHYRILISNVDTYVTNLCLSSAVLLSMYDILVDTRLQRAELLFVSGECQASAAYIDQLQEVFDYNVPNKVAGFFSEPIQVHFEYIKIFQFYFKIYYLKVQSYLKQKSNSFILWRVISVKLNIGRKITSLEIMALNQENLQHVSRLIELIFKGELHCLQGSFRKQTGREDV